ncbi:MAG: hypothetical protein LC732_06475 [Acidobacteria bacterium]|nr:hypothetical protein [Acidobacteriota bacterium]
MWQLARITLIFMAITGCATARQGPLQRIRIESDPPGSTISAERCGLRVGSRETPATILVSRRATQCEISVSHSGYHTTIVPLEREFSELVVGNANALAVVECCDEGFSSLALGLAGLVTGVLVDAASGAMYELQPAHFFVELEPIEPGWGEEAWRDGIYPPDESPPDF